MSAKPKIENPEATISEIQKQPAAELEALKSFRSECQTKQADPDPQTSVLFELLGERTQSRITDFERWPVESRALRLADIWVAENAAELVALLRSNLTERTKSKDGILASVGKRAAELSIQMFAPSRDRVQLAAEREKAELEAEALEADIVTAHHTIRRLEIEPSLATFREADAAVRRVNFSLGDSGS